MRCFVGTYIGDDNPTQAITGVGFTPDVVLIESFLNGFTYMSVKTNDFSSNDSGRINSQTGSIDTDQILSIDADGFTVGSGKNNSAVTYTYTCLSLDPACLAAGSYIGTGADDRSVFVGFVPDVVLVVHDDAAVRNRWWWSTVGGDASLNPGGFDAAFVADCVQGVNVNGFIVGATFNVFGKNYYWIAFKAKPGNVAVGTYVANEVDDTPITGLGLTPKSLFIKKTVAATGSLATHTAVRQDSISYTGDVSGTVGAAGFNPDIIQSLDVDGFTIGANADVNSNTNTYSFLGLADEPVVVITSSTSTTTSSTSSTSTSTSSSTTSTTSLSSSTTTSTSTSSSSFTSTLMSFNEVTNENLIGNTPYFWNTLPHMYRDISDSTLR